jgi:hypothetical protein
MKKYYSKIKVDKYESMQTLDWYATNIYHPTQQDEDGKFKKGALRLRDTHREMFSALLVLLITKTISRRNKINEYSDKYIPYNIEKGLELKVQPYEIKAIITRGLKNAISLQTTKNRMDRLEELGVISRRWIRSEGVFSILFNPRFLTIKCGESGKLIKTNDFENNSESVVYKSKNENLINTTKYKNKIIQDEPVNKRNVHSHINNSLKPKHLKNQNKTVQNNSFGSTKNTDTPHEPTIAVERSNSITNEKLCPELESYKKKAVNKFYEKFIMAFWQHLTSMYLITQAPRQTLHYVEQAYQSLMTDDYYFGGCTTEKQINYQLNKLLKALKSTINLVNARKKENTRWTMDHVYPNQFLCLPPEKGKMRFKNALLHIEEFMAIHDEMDMLIEKQMQKSRDKKKKSRYNYIISQIIAWIMLNAKEKTVSLIRQAGEYLRDIHPELSMKLHTDFNNPYLVKKIINAHKTFDYKLINECFTTQAQIQEEINKLLPKMQQLIRQNRLTISPKMLIHFKIRGDEMKPIPKKYNKYTLNLINRFLR